MYTTRSRTYRSSNGAPTPGYLNRMIKEVLIENKQLRLIDLEHSGLVAYNAKDGTYQLTEEGMRFLTGGGNDSLS